MFITRRKHEELMAEKDREIADRRSVLLDVLPTDAKAVLALMRDNWSVPFAMLAADASYESGLNISPQRVREILRGFKAIGLANYGSTYDEDSAAITGSGYFLTGPGTDLRDKLAA